MGGHSHKINCEACDIEDEVKVNGHHGPSQGSASPLETPGHQFSCLYTL